MNPLLGAPGEVRTSLVSAVAVACVAPPVTGLTFAITVELTVKSVGVNVVTTGDTLPLARSPCGVSSEHDVGFEMEIPPAKQVVEVTVVALHAAARSRANSKFFISLGIIP
jgi:hypothetical protein